ncbi:MAG TPA: hybrid sensor histidine kinase/response regulator [Polyangiaceae bacterium]|nr:hybrid sensor histidine kinase/response regulator [Polyangiaceae bacterium]
MLRDQTPKPRNTLEPDSAVKKVRNASDPATVLVVDDDDRNRRLLRAQLEPPYRVVEAASGDEALAVVRADTVDLVLLDVMMPGKSGYETCRELKALTKGTFLPVILLTALTDQDHRNEGLAARADDYLAKPANRIELELRVQAFLRIAMQERAIQSQLTALRQLSALKDDLVSLIVHDLRNPLAGMLPILKAAADSTTDPTLRDDLRIALDGGEKMRRALEDLLRVRQLEEGRIVLRRELVDLGELFGDAIRTAEGEARRREVQVTTSIEGPPVAMLDRDLVRRAIENLLVNSVKFSPRGSTVTLAARAVGAMLEISVADRGRGVPEAYRERLFAKFGALDLHGSSSRQGFGLGLYLVRLVSTAHGGDASVEDAAGGGAVFRMLLDASGSASD